MLTFNIDNIKASERKAFDTAISFTNQIETILKSNEVVTIEKLTGTEALGAEAIAVLNTFIAALNSPAVAATVTLVNTFLGGLGQNLTAVIHEGQVVVSGIGHWIDTFEHLFRNRNK